jgi:hypothetical protein
MDNEAEKTSSPGQSKDQDRSKPETAALPQGRAFLRRIDLIVIALILLVAGAFYLVQKSTASDATAVALVIIDNELVDKIELCSGAPQNFTYPQRPHVVLHRYEDGSIAFLASDCPDQICVNTGRLSLPYHQAACLPNQFILSVQAIENATELTTQEDVDLVR